MSCVHVVRIHRNGGPEELRYEEVEVGDPGPGEARVRHTAIGLNFTDIHHRTGRYPLPQFPHVIGTEAAGVVEAVGAGVTDIRPGDRKRLLLPSGGYLRRFCAFGIDVPRRAFRYWFGCANDCRHLDRLHRLGGCGLLRSRDQRQSPGTRSGRRLSHDRFGVG